MMTDEPLPSLQFLFNPFPGTGIRRRLRPSRPSSLADAKCLPVGPR